MHHASESPGEVELLMGLMGWLSSNALKIPTEIQGMIFSFLANLATALGCGKCSKVYIDVNSIMNATKARLSRLLMYTEI